MIPIKLNEIVSALDSGQNLKIAISLERLIDSKIEAFKNELMEVIRPYLEQK